MAMMSRHRRCHALSILETTIERTAPGRKPGIGGRRCWKHRRPAKTQEGQVPMSQHLANSTCSLIPGINGDLQVVHSRSGQTVIDVQSVHFDVAGQIQHDHSTIRLTYDAVRELRELLDRIAEPMEPRQSALWSDATFSRPVHTRRTRRKRRAPT